MSWRNGYSFGESADGTAGGTIVKFGKHTGSRFDELPYSYRLWAVWSDDAKSNRWVRLCSLFLLCRRGAGQAMCVKIDFENQDRSQRDVSMFY